MAIKMTNNAASTLASNVSSGATSFTVASGSSFPTFSSGDHSYVTIGTEVIKVTARNSAVFTCIATGASHSAGDTVELRVTAELLNDFSTDAESLAKAGGEMSGNITMAGSQTVDGRDLSADGSKLDGIDTGAKNDQTASEIKTLLEDGIDSVHYVNASIDTEHIADDQVTAAKLANSINTDIATGVTANTTANAAMPKSGGAFTGNITTNGLIDTRDVAADGVLATNAMPKSGGAFTGNITTNGLIDTRDVAADGVLATNAMPKSGGAFTGNITTNGLIDTRDVAADGVLATNALPKSGGTMTGNLTQVKTASNTSVLHTISGAHSGTAITGASGNSGSQLILKNTQTTNGNFSAINFQDAQGNTNAAILGINVSHASNHGDLVFFTRGGIHADGAEAMRINQHGNVGIGTTTPQNELHIVTANESLVHIGGQPNANGNYQGISLGYAETNNSLYRKVAIVSRGIQDGNARQDFNILVDTAANTGSAVLADSKFSISGLTGVITIDKAARSAASVENDGSFDLNSSNSFICTPSGNFTLTFTNIAASQSGNILLINSGGHTVAAHSNTKVDAKFLATVSTAGTYLLAYFSDGTNVYMTNSAIYT